VSVDSVLSVHGYMSRTVVDYDSNRNRDTNYCDGTVGEVRFYIKSNIKSVTHTVSITII